METDDNIALKLAVLILQVPYLNILTIEKTAKGRIDALLAECEQAQEEGWKYLCIRPDHKGGYDTDYSFDGDLEDTEHYPLANVIAFFEDFLDEESVTVG